MYCMMGIYRGRHFPKKHSMYGETVLTTETSFQHSISTGKGSKTVLGRFKIESTELILSVAEFVNTPSKKDEIPNEDY